MEIGEKQFGRSLGSYRARGRRGVERNIRRGRRKHGERWWGSGKGFVK